MAIANFNGQFGMPFGFLDAGEIAPILSPCFRIPFGNIDGQPEPTPTPTLTAERSIIVVNVQNRRVLEFFGDITNSNQIWPWVPCCPPDARTFNIANFPFITAEALASSDNIGSNTPVAIGQKPMNRPSQIREAKKPLVRSQLIKNALATQLLKPKVRRH